MEEPAFQLYANSPEFNAFKCMDESLRVSFLRFVFDHACAESGLVA